jgi:hypothetical protein
MTGRRANATLWLMDLEETVFFADTGSQTALPNGTFNPCWGDYTSMMVDPVDDCTFWYVNQYIKVSGPYVWQTRFGYFFLDHCNSSIV